jgi:hypothetical protein
VYVGDLVKWVPDDDIGIVIGIVGDFGEGSLWDDEDEAGNLIIIWVSHDEHDSSVDYRDENLEVLSEGSN